MKKEISQELYKLEVNAFGIRDGAIPFSFSYPGNNAGIKDNIGGLGPQATQRPVASSGNIQSSFNVGFREGTGWWMGFDKGIPKFFVGSPTRFIAWDGQTFFIEGDFVIGNTITLAPGGDIQAAIDTLTPTGGIIYLQAGTYTLTADLELVTGISIIGAGVETTIIDCNGSNEILAVWDGVTELQAITLSNFTLQDSTATEAIYFEGVQTFNLTNLFVTNNTTEGVVILGCELFVLDRVIAENNGGIGIYIQDMMGKVTQTFSLTNCTSLDNTGAGFHFEAIDDGLNEFNVIGCSALNNGDDGFILLGGNTACEAQFTGCSGENNTLTGYYVDVTDVSFLGCQGDSNTTNGIQLEQPLNRVTGCSFAGNGDFDIYSDSGGAFIGNVFLTSTLEVSGANPLQMLGNLFQQPSTTRTEVTATNGSGGSLGEGNVVVYGDDVSGNEFTTTTTLGDPKVMGMINGATIANGASGQILQEGFTDALKVNGTIDIAVGDLLSTYSSAGIAKKAEAGETAFAVALEAYTGNDSNGIINALLITPRTLSGSGGSVDIQIFDTNDTWTKPTGSVAFIEAWGGGGGGAAGAASDAASGGGGGAYTFRTMDLDDLAGTVAVTVGTGGASVASPAAGNAGGNSSFGTHLTAYGGGAGNVSANGTPGGGGGGLLSAGVNGSSGGAGGGPLGGTAGGATVGGDGNFGGGGGGGTDGSSGFDGGNSGYGGGGGGGADDGDANGTNGGNSFQGGGGGAGGGNTSGGTGGTSVAGGAGGSGNGGNGSAPGGGGAGHGNGGDSGAGANGRVKVTVW